VLTAAYASLPIPVTVITGFLGSGKTTLLQRLLESPRLANAAVLVNEFGEVGLDHHLIRHVAENIVMLASGCVCCTIRDDLGAAMRDLLRRREAAEVPRFDELLVETTGLADPVPILHTLMTDPIVDEAFRMSTVITTVDAVNGAAQLTRQPESVKQAAVADRIVITKTDLCAPAAVRALEGRLHRLNPSAAILRAPSQELAPETLMSGSGYNIDAKSAGVRAWLAADAYHAADDEHRHLHRDRNRHDDRIAAFCLVFEEAIDWTAFSIWLTMLLHRHGADMLRIKGILNLPALSGPVVVHGVQHIIHPPVHLKAWPDDDRRSRIVFITRDIPGRALEASLVAFTHAGRVLRSKRANTTDRCPPMGTGSQIGGRPYRRGGGLSWMK
jgi:G3E family GTPase